MVEDPVLRASQSHHHYEMTREEMMQAWMKKLNYLWFHKDREFYFKTGKKARGLNPFSYWFFNYFGQSPCSLHWIMYQTSIETFCDEEQYKKWGPMAENLDCIGCYA